MATGILALLIGFLALMMSEGLGWDVAVGALALNIALAVLVIRTSIRSGSGWTWANTLAGSGVMLAAVALMQALI